MNGKTTIASVLSIMLVLTMLAGCNGEAVDKAEAPDGELAQAVGAPQDIGQGSTVFTFEVTDDKSEFTVYNVHTDETTVGAALLAVGLIDGDETDFGLMVKYVNGLRADYELDGAYWGFLIDGEFAMTGADATEIEQGKVYAFVYTPA